jgi:tRNA threonylcarbamoyladenosine biosynthesis protein TsaE
MRETVYLSSSPEETEAVGRRLAQTLVAQGARRAFVAMYGEMGVGKTAFARGFGAALGAEHVKSPTYTVVSEHRGTPVPFFHFDMYRIADSDDLMTIGYDDYLARDGYVLCEWSENIPDDIPENAVTVRIERTENTDVRRITIGGMTDR